MARSDKAATPATLDPTKSAAKPTSKAAKPVSFDRRAFAIELLSLVVSEEVPHGTETHVVRQFVELHQTGNYEDRLPLTAECVLICEQAFKYGRADIVVYHSDGSATVIEAKDGAKGYSHVVGGIGQATLYAVQLANTKGAVAKVRRALLWSSTGDLALDGMIEDACEQAGVVALPMPTVQTMMAIREAMCRVFAKKEGAAHGRA